MTRHSEKMDSPGTHFHGRTGHKDGAARWCRG
jgi:hypothetical protein